MADVGTQPRPATADAATQAGLQPDFFNLKEMGRYLQSFPFEAVQEFLAGFAEAAVF